MSKNSALNFHTYLSMCLALSETKKEIVDSKEEFISVFWFSILVFSNMLSVNVTVSMILVIDSLPLISF